jgi:nicotinate-nucleotide--dimethylbenzimidazole phosphoribosyltransferase
MGILDDAIREHLDLKRKHGARDADLREIEDEAFGSTDRPDPFAANELFNEVGSPGSAGPEGSAAPPDQPGGLAGVEEPIGLSEPDAQEEEPTRVVEPEVPRPSEPEALRPSEPAPEEPSPEPISPPEGSAPIPGQVELPGQDEIPGQERLDDPLEGYQRSTESDPEADLAPEADVAPEADLAPEADRGSEPAPRSDSQSLEDLIAEEEPFPEDAAAPPHAPSPEDSVLPPAPDREGALEAQEPEPEPAPEPEPPSEPESSVPEPPPPPPATGPEPPGRARGRVDVPTQEHPAPGDTGGLPPLPPEEPGFEPEPLEPVDEAPSREEPLPEPEPYAEEPAGEGGSPALYDFETDEESLSSSPAPADDFEALGPAEEEGSYVEDDEDLFAEEPSGTELPAEEPGTAVRPALEDQEVYEGGAPDPEETYEEEEDEGEEGLWFEKGPPQDFDFDDDK